MKGRPFAWLGVGVFVSLGAIAAICWLLNAWWEAAPREADSVGAPQADTRWNEQATQLQTDAPAQLLRLRAAQDAALHEKARIPIEEAMRLIGSGRDFFPTKPVSPEAMRQSRAEQPPTPTP
jgi:hypothetical protein